jgi:hypothetical protein
MIMLIKIFSSIITVFAMEPPLETSTTPEGTRKRVVQELMAYRQMNETKEDASFESSSSTSESDDNEESLASENESDEENENHFSHQFLKEFFVYDEKTFNEVRSQADGNLDKMWSLLRDNDRQRIITVDPHNISSALMEDMVAYNMEALRKFMRRSPHSLKEITQAIEQNEQLQSNCQNSLNHLFKSYKALESKRDSLEKRQRDTKEYDHKLQSHHASILKLIIRFHELQKERDQYDILLLFFTFSGKKREQHAQEAPFIGKIKAYMADKVNQEIEELIKGYETRKTICEEVLSYQNEHTDEQQSQ